MPSKFWTVEWKGKSAQSELNSFLNLGANLFGAAFSEDFSVRTLLVDFFTLGGIPKHKCNSYANLGKSKMHHCLAHIDHVTGIYLYSFVYNVDGPLKEHWHL